LAPLRAGCRLNHKLEDLTTWYKCQTRVMKGKCIWLLFFMVKVIALTGILCNARVAFLTDLQLFAS
jgi:hypothetical protein